MATSYKPSTPPHTADLSLQRYLVQELTRISQVFRGIGRTSLQLYVAKGYGGLHLKDYDNFPDITGTWVPLAFDTVTPLEPFSVTVNTVNNSLAINRAGVWAMNFSFSFNHNESQSGRIMQIQLWDLTNGVELFQWITGTGRNVDFTSFATNLQIDAPGDGKELQIRVSGSGYTNVIEYTAEFNVNSISELQGI